MLFGSPIWDRMDDAQKGEVRRHQLAWQFSQFLHGEQGALMCTAKIVNTVPQIDSKYYAATQVIDEARHVEVYSRYLHDKLELTYPINPNLRQLLVHGLSDARWDFTYLTMQVLIEGLALAAFGLIRNMATDPLGRAINAYVMQDEARHVMFGRLALRDFYAGLSAAERDEREQFAVDSLYLMRDRFLGEEIWERLELPVAECVEHTDELRDAAHLPQPPVHPHRPRPQGHQPVGATGASGVRGHGRDRLRRHRPRRRHRRRRSHRRGLRPPPPRLRRRRDQRRPGLTDVLANDADRCDVARVRS